MFTLAGVLMAPDQPEPRPDDIAMLEAMGSARQPVWFAIVNPIIGISGILIGHNAASRGRGAQPTPDAQN